MNITFRKLNEDDISFLHLWLNKDHVHEWYDKDKSNTLEEIKKRYLPKIKKEKPMDCYFACIDDSPFGYLQTYKVNDWPEFGNHVSCEDKTAAIDLFIGEEKFVGKGLGKRMLKEFLAKVIFSSEVVNTCVIGPEPQNLRAISVYKSVGFRYKKIVQIPGEQQPTYIMELGKSDFLKM